LIGEEVERDKRTLQQIVSDCADVIVQRAKLGKDFGVVLLPEGLIEFMPKTGTPRSTSRLRPTPPPPPPRRGASTRHSRGFAGELIAELNEHMAHGVPMESVGSKLSGESRALFEFLPADIRKQLMMDRDPHGNVQVARIETERLLVLSIEKVLADRKAAGVYTGKFSPQTHFFGYEGRCGLPSVFDAAYCYSLGHAAAVLVQQGLTGYMAVVRGLTRPIAQWSVGGVPLTMMMNIERRHGKNKPVIKKALVELDGKDAKPFRALCAMRAVWATSDLYRNPGPIQYAGASATDLNFTLISTDASVPDLVPLVHTPTPTITMAAFNTTPGKWAFGSETSIGQYSGLQKERLSFSLEVPKALKGGLFDFQGCGRPTSRVADESLTRAFRFTGSAECVNVVSSPPIASPPLRVGLVFCGRQAPGGHNLTCGVFEGLAQLAAGSTLLGYLGGSEGLFNRRSVKIEVAQLDAFRSLGG
jgi:6-phosphofructokinase